MSGRKHISVDHVFVACLVLSSIFMVINAESHKNEVENEHIFSYSENSTVGPDHWGDLNLEWEKCDTGKLQSPIDILNGRVEVLSTLGKLRRTYKSAPAVMSNRGHDIMVAWKGDAGGIVINGTKYGLLQCHWHTPSEHTVAGRKFNMELHVVHSSPDAKIAVVGILYTLGHPDPFLDKLLGHLHSLGEEKIELGRINPREIKFGSRKYYRYLGSLTVPPCKEGVTWTLLKKVRTVSREQIRALRKAVHDGFEDNARPVQPWDGRSVYMYRPESP